MIEPLIIRKTKDEPKVVLNSQQGIFEFSGWSLPEDTQEFYNPILAWINEYFKNPNDKTEFIFDFDYVNSSSVQALITLVTILKNFNDSGIEISIKWFYMFDDEDILDTGEKLKDLVEFDIELIQK